MPNRKGSAYAPSMTRSARAKRGRPTISLSLSEADLARLDAIVADDDSDRTAVIHAALNALERERKEQ